MSPLDRLHAGPAAGFDAPFEMLHACHERVQRSLALLERTLAHVRQHGADAQAQEAARDVLRYFDLAAPLHHEDEERHVLPRLRAQGRGALAARLAADHVAMAAGWAALRPALVALSRGDAGALAHAAWADAAARWAASYAEHIALEEGDAFSAARISLDAAAEAAMGTEMARRRGVPATSTAPSGRA